MNALFVGYEYGSDADSQAVYDRANATLKECSIWRTSMVEQGRWFILGFFPNPEDAEGFDWGDSVPFAPTKAQKEWMLHRRMGRAVTAILEGKDKLREITHYDDEETAPRMPAPPPEEMQ